MNKQEQVVQKDKNFWMEQLRMNSDLSVANPSIFEDLESYGDVFYGTETDLYPLPRNPIIGDVILDGKHCDVYLISKEDPSRPDIFIHIGRESTLRELREAGSKRKSFNQFSTDNWQSDQNQIRAEGGA
ncbi:MAG: hypothetical protein NTU76_03040 [Candidatus Taylorbacteria bacterium]|nr:hypothetical protein [Candidatus Taylorbacteria bacterium]